MRAVDSRFNLCLVCTRFSVQRGRRNDLEMRYYGPTVDIMAGIFFGRCGG